MLKHIIAVTTLFMFTGCVGTFKDPKVDFKEDDAFLNKIKSKYSDNEKTSNETNSLYDESSIDLLSDFKVDLGVGDVVYITINENISRNSIGRRETISNSNIQMNPMNVAAPSPNHEITSKIIGKLQPFFNLGVESDNSSTFQGTANSINEETFETSINAMVTRKVTDDLFYIEANKSILLSGEKQTLKLTGYVHKNDIDNKYMISSNKVVELKVSYENEGMSEDAMNSSEVKRVIDKLFF